MAQSGAYYGIQSAGAMLRGMSEAYNRNTQMLANMHMFTVQQNRLKASDARQERNDQFRMGQAKLSNTFQMMSAMNETDSQIAKLMTEMRNYDPVAGREAIGQLQGQVAALQSRKQQLQSVYNQGDGMFTEGLQLNSGPGTLTLSSGGASQPSAVGPTGPGDPVTTVHAAVPAPQKLTGIKVSTPQDQAMKRDVLTAAKPEYSFNTSKGQFTYDVSTNVFRELDAHGKKGDPVALDQDPDIPEDKYRTEAIPIVDQYTEQIVGLTNELKQIGSDTSNANYGNKVKQVLEEMNRELKPVYNSWGKEGEMPSKMQMRNMQEIFNKINPDDLPKETGNLLLETVSEHLNRGDNRGRPETGAGGIDRRELSESAARLQDKNPSLFAKIDSIWKTAVTGGGINAYLPSGWLMKGGVKAIDKIGEVTGKFDIADDAVQNFRDVKYTPDQLDQLVQENATYIKEQVAQSNDFIQEVFDETRTLNNAINNNNTETLNDFDPEVIAAAQWMPPDARFKYLSQIVAQRILEDIEGVAREKLLNEIAISEHGPVTEQVIKGIGNIPKSINEAVAPRLRFLQEEKPKTIKYSPY